MLADFTVRVEMDPPREVRVLVYESLDRLRAAATRYDNSVARPSRRRRGRHADTVGICHRFEVQRDGVPQPLCAVVRLAEPHVGVGVVSHEMTHAAVWLRELYEGEPLTCAGDELLCWLVGELVRQSALQLHALGVWT